MPNKYTVTTFGVSFGQNKTPYTHTYLCTTQANRPFMDTVNMCGRTSYPALMIPQGE